MRTDEHMAVGQAHRPRLESLLVPVNLSGKYPGWNGTLTRARLETEDTGDYVSSLRGPGCWATTGPVCPRWGPPKGRSG